MSIVNGEEMLYFVDSFMKISIINVDSYVFEKKIPDVDADMPRDLYCTMDDLQERFFVSRYQLSRYLRLLNIEPFGELRNLREGKRIRGVGKQCFDIAVINDIEQLLFNTIDIEDVKNEAYEIVASQASQGSVNVGSSYAIN